LNLTTLPFWAKILPLTPTHLQQHYFSGAEDMATSVPEVHAALETACQFLKSVVTAYQQTIKDLNNQIRGNEENLNELGSQANPTQDTLDQIKKINQMLASLRDQLSKQQDGLVAAENDYEANCPPSK
jgi:predicted  nucleic acid-binding Zn-ribbon protein